MDKGRAGKFITHPRAYKTFIPNFLPPLFKELFTKKIGGAQAVRLLDMLFERPLISVSDVVLKFKISRQAATQLVNKFSEAGILNEVSGKKRYRKYLFADYIKIIARGTEI